jgi:hypothetical protein
MVLATASVFAAGAIAFLLDFVRAGAPAGEPGLAREA